MNFKPMMVSVVIPCYNSSRFIDECLRSILKQTYDNLEVICVDDCSSDGTYELLAKYSNSDSRLRIAKTDENTGSANFPIDYGVSLSKGDFISIIGHDDVVEPDFIEKLLSVHKRTGADIVTARMTGFNAEEKELFSVPSENFDFNRVMTGREAVNLTIGSWKIGMNGALILKSIWQGRSKYLDRSFRHMNADEFASREILTMAKTVAFCDVVYHYRKHDGAITKNLQRAVESLITDYENIMLFEKKYGCYSAERRKAATVCISGIMDRIRSENKDEVRHLIRKCYHQLTWGMIWTSHVSVKRKLLFSLPYCLTEKIYCFNRKTFDAG